MWIFWLVLIVLFLIAEAATVNMTTIWFAAGALASLIANLLNVELWLQLLIFFLVSVVCLLLFILVFKPRMAPLIKGPVSTNADRIIGEEARVIKEILPLKKAGQIEVLGQIWSAIAEDGQSSIPEGATVRVLAIHGVKAVVRPTDPASAS